ncbi:Aldo/keto reductase [Laetiporus sulphureus 93-53]|uniref:Aldo/keto reductase n=1 Tax=Laetiporus sulphureus 93-53 TaxID=1314785 RepID=A0A165F157_9APHY|nr:Aldo/keto reductase [Laetiporus sulphureus 93-53]KZT08149.1 Aldo/keto reductase [Laetiporus sulphureus 93-53]
MSQSDSPVTRFWAPPPEPATKLGRHRQLAPLAGVHVSPICLGGLSLNLGGKVVELGLEGLDKEKSFELLDAFHGAGGNFIDTASNYQDEMSEKIIGEWMETRGIRDQMVIATKYTANIKRTANLLQKTHYVGNNLKSLHLAIEGSLKKLRTSYVDILYLHWWDWCCGVEEVMNALHNLVVQPESKVLYLGVSDTPAWVVAETHMRA